MAVGSVSGRQRVVGLSVPVVPVVGLAAGLAEPVVGTGVGWRSGDVAGRVLGAVGFATAPPVDAGAVVRGVDAAGTRAPPGASAGGGAPAVARAGAPTGAVATGRAGAAAGARAHAHARRRPGGPSAPPAPAPAPKARAQPPRETPDREGGGPLRPTPRRRGTADPSDTPAHEDTVRPQWRTQFYGKP